MFKTSQTCSTLLLSPFLPLHSSRLASPTPHQPLSSPSPMHLASGKRRGGTPNRSTSSADPPRSHCINPSIHIWSLPLLCATLSLTLVLPNPDLYLFCPFVSKYAHFLTCIPSIHFLGEWAWAISLFLTPTPHTHALAHIVTKYW